MDALLLSAGFGKRLAPLTDILPKCLMPIHGRALLSIWLESLVNAGITNIFVNIHAHADQVASFIQRSRYKDYVTLLDEKDLLGTAGTLRNFESHFTHENIFIAHADNLTLFDFDAFIDFHKKRENGITCTLVSFASPQPETCGIISLNQKNHVIYFEEKPEKPISNLANGAVYIFERGCLFSLLSAIPEATDISHHLLPQLIGRMQAYENKIYHRDIGNVLSYGLAQKEVLGIPQALELLTNISPYWQSSAELIELRRRFISLAHNIGMESSVIELIGKKS